VGGCAGRDGVGVRGRACQPQRKGLLLLYYYVPFPVPILRGLFTGSARAKEVSMEFKAAQLKCAGEKRKVLDIILKRTHLTWHNMKPQKLSLPLWIDYLPSQSLFRFNKAETAGIHYTPRNTRKTSHQRTTTARP